jgi:hypothetical protein
MNLIRQQSPRALLLLVLFLLLPRIANACGCYRNSTVQDAYEAADLVIIARLSAVIKGPARNFTDISHVTMTVEKVFKGTTKTGAELLFDQGDGVVDCAWDFEGSKVGERYLLYLYQPEKPSERFSVSKCERSTGLEYAKEDLLYIENIDKRRGHTRVSGVMERNDGDFEDEAGQQVRIAGKNKTYIATTDKDGVFEIYDLPPGRYSIEPILQPGWKVDEWLVTQEQKRGEWKPSPIYQPAPPKVWFTLRAKKHFSAQITLALADE